MVKNEVGRCDGFYISFCKVELLTGEVKDSKMKLGIITHEILGEHFLCVLV